MKFPFILMAVFLLISCNAAQDSGENQPQTTIAADSEPQNSPQTARVLQNGVPALNNGAKWKADQNTNDNVERLQDVYTRFQMKTNPAEGDYLAFQEEMSAALNQLISQCKMKGADHDALHVWLEPLLHDNANLAKSASVQEMADITQTIGDRLAVYDQTFD